MNKLYLQALQNSTMMLLVVVLTTFASSAQTIDVGPPDTSICTGTPLQLSAVFTNSSNLTASGVTPTNVSLTDDSYTPVVNIGFSFNFFGNNYTQCLIGSNNYITFDLTDAGGYSPWSIGAPIPSSANPVNSIMCPWQDINPGIGGTVSYATAGTAPNRVFIVSYFEVPMFSCTGDCFTNQIVLYEGSNIIETHIFEKPLCATWNGGAAIHGLQNATGTTAVVAPGRNYPTQWTATIDGYRFTPDGSGSYTATAIPFDPYPMGITNGITWTDDSGNIISTSASITVNPTVPTVYTATWSSSCTSATFSDSILVSIGNVNITVDAVDASCYGFYDGGVEVNPAGSVFPVVIDLDDDQGNTIQTIPNVYGVTNFSGLPAGDYTANVTDGVGCTTSLDFSVDHPTLLIPNAGHIDILCNGDNNGRAFATPIGGVGPYDLSWNDPLQQVTDTIFFLPPGAFTVTVTDANNCVSDTTVMIDQPLPLVLQLSSGADTCLLHNGAIMAEIQGGTFPYTYVWSSIRDSAHYLVNNIPSFNLLTGLSSGDFEVLVLDSNSCEITGSVSVPLITPPHADFLSRSKPEEFTNPEVQFDNESSNALTYEWHFGDENVSYDENPTHSYDTAGVFLVMLIAYNEPEYGCADTTFRYMDVDPMFTFYVPSGFTPDGDGLNDTWGPIGQNFEIESYNLKIVDRWGKIVWQTDNPLKLWDGTDRAASEDVKQGIYVYVLELKKFNTFEPKVIKGTVTLYRHN